MCIRDSFESDPRDLASADRWLAELEGKLYEAERVGTMQQLYREGQVAALLAKHAPSLAGRKSFARVSSVWHMANEPLGPGTPRLVLETVEADPALREDERFVKLLAGTVEYAKKEPAAHEQYVRAQQRLAR